MEIKTFHVIHMHQLHSKKKELKYYGYIVISSNRNILEASLNALILEKEILVISD